MADSLGSGQVESDPTRRILHFGSPDEDFLPAHPDPVPEPAPTREPEPQVYGPEEQQRPERKAMGALARIFGVRR